MSLHYLPLWVSGHNFYVTVVFVIESTLTDDQEKEPSQHERIMHNHFDSDLPPYSQPSISSSRDNDACSAKLCCKLPPFSPRGGESERTKDGSSECVTTYSPSGIVRAN